MPPGKTNVDAAVEELTGGAPAAAAPAKPAKAKAPAKNKAKVPSNNKSAAPAAPAKPAKVAAPAKPTKPAKAAATPAATKGKGKPPAKPAKASKGNGKATAGLGLSARGTGKFFFDPAAREALRKELAQKVRKPVSTKEYAAEHGHETWKVRLAAADLANQGKMKLVKTKGTAVLTMQKVG